MPARAASWWARSLSMHKALDNVPQPMTGTPASSKSPCTCLLYTSVGFPLHSKWTSEEYLRFLRQNGWAVRKSAVLKASFPLTYAECVKTEV